MKRQALAATFWSASDAILRYGVQVATTLVLARLLLPADFGLVAMLALFTSIAGILTDGGFSVALIQRRDISHVDESTAFWCNLGIGAVLSCVLVLIAPVVAGFYGIPRLEQLMRWLAWSPVLSAMSGAHVALLTRKLEFKTLAKAGLVGSVTSGAVAILVALRGGGVWALVVQALLMPVITNAMLWLLHSWKPGLSFSVVSFRKLAGFGGYVLASAMLETIYSRLYAVLIGRRFGPTEVGYFSNADTARGLPLGFLASLLTRVGLPMLSAAGDNAELKARGFEFASRAGMLFNALLMLVPMAFPEQVLALMFGPQWIPAAPLLRILALAGLLHPLHVLNLQLLLSAGLSADYFRIEIWKKVVGVGFLAVGAYYGPAGLAWSQVALSLFALWINASRSHRLIGYGLSRQLADLWPTLLAVGLAWGCGAAVDDHLPGWTANLLTRCMVVGLVFLVVVLVLWWTQLKDVVQGVLQSMGKRAGGSQIA